jgi:hypothetical protein
MQQTARPGRVFSTMEASRRASADAGTREADHKTTEVSCGGKRNRALALADPADGARMCRRQLGHRMGGKHRGGFHNASIARGRTERGSECGRDRR